MTEDMPSVLSVVATALPAKVFCNVSNIFLHRDHGVDCHSDLSCKILSHSIINRLKY